MFTGVVFDCMYETRKQTRYHDQKCARHHHSRNTEGLQFYTDEKVIDSLVGSIKRFKNEKRFEPATGKAAFALVTLENAINKARAEILDYVDPEPTEENANDTASATV